MWSTVDTTAALVRARNDEFSLTETKNGNPDPPKQNGDQKTAQLLESLGAVVPTGVTAIYTTVAAPLHQIAADDGTKARSSLQAAMTKAGKSADEIEAALGRLTQEATNMREVRIAFLVLAAAIAVTMVYRSAASANAKTRKKRKYVVAEPLTAFVAFAGWSLALPGTPLGAYLTMDQMRAWPLIAAGVAGFVLFGLGTELSQPAKRTKA